MSDRGKNCNCREGGWNIPVLAIASKENTGGILFTQDISR